MLIVTLHRRVRGQEALEHFAFASAAALFVPICTGCLQMRAALCPAELMFDDEDNVSLSGSFLCEPCSMALPTLPPNRRDGWPESMTALEVERLWKDVRKEQRAEVERQAARVAAAARGETTLDEFERTLRAAHQAARHHQSEIPAEAVHA